MFSIPFFRYIIALLLLNDNISKIKEQVQKKGFFIQESEIEKIHEAICSIPIKSAKDIISKNTKIDFENKNHIDILDHLKVRDYVEYASREYTLFEEPPENTRYILDCMWILSHRDVSMLVNTFLFNEEPDLSIIKILKFKYRKCLLLKSIETYKHLFFDTSKASAKDVFKYMPYMRDTSSIIRKMVNGESEIEVSDTVYDNLIDMPINIVDSSYLKWKIGYKNVEVPGPKEFFESVQKDSMFNYYEAVNLVRSEEVDIEDDDGEGPEGPIRVTRVKRRKRNRSESRASLARKWLDMYIKANDNMPKNSEADDDFFDQLNQVRLDFEEHDGEKIIRADDIAGLFEDIAEDM